MCYLMPVPDIAPSESELARTAHNTLAPWAEPVPGTGPMTVDQLLALPQDAWMYELVEGRLVRMPASGGEVSAIAARLLIALGIFVEPRGLGTLTGADATCLPDVA
jgi:Uma2 family endonuclease